MIATDKSNVLTLNPDDNLVAYAKDIAQQLRAPEVRVTSDPAPNRSKPRSPKPESESPHDAGHRWPRCGSGKCERAFAWQRKYWREGEGEVIAEILQMAEERR
ncbi:MAG: hypothetical protein ABI042_11350 [Verrucomicrobiota bacterium]